VKLKTALRLGRVSNLPTVWTNALAGGVLATGAPPDAAAYLTLAVALSASYVGGMYLNDAFDRAHDAQHQPGRPIPAGEASASSVFGSGFGLLALGCALVPLAAASGGGSVLRALTAALALVAAIVLYDAFHKQNPLSPVVMALCRVLSYATAGLSVAVLPSLALALGASVLFVYLIGLTYLAKLEGAGRLRLAPRAIGQLIAGISLLDGALVAWAGPPWLGASCVLGFVLTRRWQRHVPGT
jgi:4-hydroxybenzoate polyprenyltransferase